MKKTIGLYDKVNHPTVGVKTLRELAALGAIYPEREEGWKASNNKNPYPPRFWARIDSETGWQIKRLTYEALLRVRAWNAA